MTSRNSTSSSNFSYFSSVNSLPYAHQYSPNASKPKKRQSQKRQSQEQQQQQPNPQVNTQTQQQHNNSDGVIAVVTDPNSSYFAFFDTPAFPTFPQGEETFAGDIDETFKTIPSSPRRSMSPIGGAASAMKSFLRKRRGTLNSTIGNTDTQHSTSESKAIDSFNTQPSAVAQSFVFVGGYGVEPGTTLVLNETDNPPSSSPSSHIYSQASLSRNLAAGSVNYPTATATTISQQTFSQVMTSHLYNQGMGAIQIPISDNRNHSCHTSMTATPTLAPNAASGSFSSISSDSSSSSPPTSFYFHTQYPTNPTSQRDLEISNTQFFQTGKHSMFQSNQKDPPFEAPAIQSNNDSPHSSRVLNDADNKQGRDRVHRKSDPPIKDNWADRSMISKELTLAFNVSGFPDSVLKIGFGDKAEIEEESPDESEGGKSTISQQNQNTKGQPQVVSQEEPQHNNSIQSHLAGSGFNSSSNGTKSTNQVTGSLGRNNSNNHSQKHQRHSSDSGVQSKNRKNTFATEIQDTNAALQDLENEIQVLRSKEINLPAIDQVIEETPEELEVPSSTQSKQRRIGDNILLISDSSSPTQFYDADHTRYALRTFLIGGDREFDEMIECGFPSEIFPDSSSGTDDKRSTRTATASDPLTDMSCRYLTLRVTLTPWHARADEHKLYGSDSTTSTKTQFKTMVNKIFSRSPAATPASVYSHPPSQRVRMYAGSRRPSEQSNTTSVSARSSSEHPASALTRIAPGSRRESGSAQPTLIRSSLDEDKELNLSRSSSGSANNSPIGSRPSSRAFSGDSLRRDSNSVISDQLVGSSMQLQTPSIVRIPPASPVIIATEGIIPNREVNSPPSTRAPSPLPATIGISQQSQFQLPRKGSLTTLSVPIKENQESSQNYGEVSDNGGSTMPPFIRKGSAPAILNTAGSTGALHVQVAERNREINLASIPRSLTVEGRPVTPRRISSISYINPLGSTESLNQTSYQPNNVQQQPQEQKRSLRYPYQQHTLYQEQIQLQQNQSRLTMSNNSRSPLHPVTFQQPHPLSTMSYATSPDAAEQIYDYYQNATVEKYQPLEPEQTESKPVTQQGLKLFSFSSRDKKQENGDKTPLAEQTLAPAPVLAPAPAPAPVLRPAPGPAPAIPPRINAKSSKRRGSQQRQTDSGVPSDAAILAAAIAAANASGTEYDLPYQILEYREVGHSEWNSGYAEDRHDNGGYVCNGQGGANGYYHNNQTKAAATSSGGY
ncbi:hypothetical protein BGZ76_011426 [Entomortierella beljakovae]|nr:hypothetical protein BGZ76_011426 [Entomortierella beljakovae]